MFRLPAEIDEMAAKIKRLEAEIEKLKATLDGDPHWTTTPEQRYEWRLSAIRYADKVEAERDALRGR